MAQKKQKDLFKKDTIRAYLKERKEKSIPQSQTQPETETEAETKREVIIENAIQIASDIHLEFVNVLQKMPTIKVKAPILALLGDIGYPHSTEYQQFIKECSAKFKHVILITGNHEYYTKCIESVHQTIRGIANQYNNVHFLNCDALELPDVIPNTVILGCTLWIKFDDQYASNAMEQINDYTYISTDDSQQNPLRVSHTNALYDEHIAFITTQCEKAKVAKKQVIVLTHHAPTDYNCIDPNYFNHISYLMNFTNIEHLFQPPVVAWLFGHTHFNMDLVVKCDLKQMQFTETEQDVELEAKHNNNNNNNNNMDNDRNDDENGIWYVRLATNQQGYLHRGISDGYLLHKVIEFPIELEMEKEGQIEVIDYSRLVILPFIKRINNISD